MEDKLPDKTFNTSQRVDSYEDLPDKLTKEYDLVIKSGFQTINLKIGKGNTELMKSLIIVCYLKSLSVQSGRHTFVDDIGEVSSRILDGRNATIINHYYHLFSIMVTRNISTVYGILYITRNLNHLDQQTQLMISTFLDILISIYAKFILLTLQLFILLNQSIQDHL